MGQHLQQLGTEVFNNGFVSAMRWTLLLPLGFVLIAALCCFGINKPTGPLTSKPGQR